MPKLKLTKTELKKQRDALKRYQRFLPTLALKKEQLISEIRRVEKEMKKLSDAYEAEVAEVKEWQALFSEKPDFPELLRVEEIKTSQGNVAGVTIPVFDDITFEEKPYDLYTESLWVDSGVAAVKSLAELRARLAVCREQKELLEHELRVTIQRINLFEKVMIPACSDAIRRIRIYLGDQDANAVARGKIAKAKLAQEQRESA